MCLYVFWTQCMHVFWGLWSTRWCIGTHCCSDGSLTIARCPCTPRLGIGTGRHWYMTIGDTCWTVFISHLAGFLKVGNSGDRQKVGEFCQVLCGNWPALTCVYAVRATRCLVLSTPTHWQSLKATFWGRCRGCMADWPWCMTYSIEEDEEEKEMSASISRHQDWCLSVAGALCTVMCCWNKDISCHWCKAARSFP